MLHNQNLFSILGLETHRLGAPPSGRDSALRPPSIGRCAFERRQQVIKQHIHTPLLHPKSPMNSPLDDWKEKQISSIVHTLSKSLIRYQNSSKSQMSIIVHTLLGRRKNKNTHPF